MKISKAGEFDVGLLFTKLMCSQCWGKKFELITTRKNFQNRRKFKAKDRRRMPAKFMVHCLSCGVNRYYILKERIKREEFLKTGMPK